MSPADATLAARPAGPQFHTWLQRVTTAANAASSRLVDTHHQCLYGEVPAALQAIQAHLASLGVAAGDCVAVELNNSVAAALLLLGLLDGGYGLVLSPARGNHRADPTVPAFCAWNVAVRTDAAARQGALQDPASYLLARRNEAFARSDAVVRLADYVLLRSSGSLSVPKLVAHRPERLIGNALNVQARLQLREHQRVSLPVPIFHMYGLGAGFLPALSAGASIDFLEGANVLTYLERERSFDPNVAFLTPTFCDFLLRVRRAPRRYDFVVSAGDTIAPSVFDRMEELHGPLLNLYGSTEMGSISVASGELSPEVRRACAGSPYPGVQCRIAEGAFDEDAQRGFGELQVRHEFGFEGYVDAEGRFIDVSTAFDAGWFRTGDYATAHADGTLRVLGRRDLSVKRNGVLLPLSDVEHRLREIAGVRQAAVAVGAESMRGRRLIAFCVPEEGASLSGTEVRVRYAAGVPAYAVPDDVRIVAALPTLANGKVDRRALGALAQQLEGGG